MSGFKKDMLHENANKEDVRLNRFLSDAGFCSRREADRLIEAGRVTVDGVRAELGTRVRKGQKVRVGSQLIRQNDRMVLIAFNKPRGIVCTTDRIREKNNIIDYLHYPKRIYPVGRLDKDSEGLILLTNDGELGNEILRARNFHEKEYIVTVNRPVTDEFLRGMAGGVPILDTITRKCKVEKLDKRKFRIVLTQGLNRQIRRMCEYFGYRVVKLVRVRIMNIKLGNLPVGKYRDLTHQEWEGLLALLSESGKEE